MCDEYGIELTEEHLEGVKQIANENGEVRKGILFKLYLLLYSGP